MTIEEIFFEYGYGAIAGLILGIFPLVLGLVSRQKLFAVLSEVIGIICGAFFSLIGAILSALACSMLLYFRMKLIRDDERKENAKKAARTLAANQNDIPDTAKERPTERKIFITATNPVAAPFATMLYERLTAMNYQVVTDNIALTPALQETGVDALLDQASDILAIMTPGCLAPTNKLDSKGDFTLQEELIYALEQEKNIISVVMPGFEWPDSFPRGLGSIHYMNGVKANAQKMDAVLERIVYCLTPISESNDSSVNTDSQTSTANS